MGAGGGWGGIGEGCGGGERRGSFLGKAVFRP